MSKKVLLTGATGFVGYQVFNNLKINNFKIRLVIRDGKTNFIRENKSETDIVVVDDLFIKSEDWWAEQCKDIDIVIHTAWYVEPGKYLDSTKNIDCLIGSLNLAKGAIKAGVKRLVGIGTCFEYDLNIGEISIDTPLKPTTLYSKSKAALFSILSELLIKKGMEFVWCRLFYLYGDGEDERRFVPYLHKQLSKNKIAQLTTGKQVRDFMNVSDVAKIILKISLDKNVGPINICSGIPITVKEFAEKIADKYGRRDLLKFGARPENIIDPNYVVGIPNYQFNL
jgi:nucleoside-diphosphate-sugar epimerase